MLFNLHLSCKSCGITVQHLLSGGSFQNRSSYNPFKKFKSLGYSTYEVPEALKPESSQTLGGC